MMSGQSTSAAAPSSLRHRDEKGKCLDGYSQLGKSSAIFFQGKSSEFTRWQCSTTFAELFSLVLPFFREDASPTLKTGIGIISFMDALVVIPIAGARSKKKFVYEVYKTKYETPNRVNDGELTAALTMLSVFEKYFVS